MIVEKFGGSSVCDTQKIKQVARFLKHNLIKAKKIVVVVSAMGKTTNKDIALAKKLCDIPNPKALDFLLNTGEMKSASLLCVALSHLGLKAEALTGWQAGIKTTKSFGKAYIKDVDTKTILKKLETNDILVICGFQGVCRKSLTTLGRGGSDTTAVALAAKLGCPCNIYSDVEGVFDANPNEFKEAKILPVLDYDTALFMSSLGAKVLDTRCLELGKKFNVKLCAKKSLEKDKNKGSKIIMKKPFLEEMKVVSIAVQNDLFKAEIKTKDLSKVLRCFCLNNLNLDMFSFDGEKIKFVFAKNQEKIIEKMLKTDLKTQNYAILKDFSRISLIGTGFVTHPQIVQKAIKTLSKNSINCLDFSVNENAFSFLIFKKDKQSAVTKLAELFGL